MQCGSVSVGRLGGLERRGRLGRVGGGNGGVGVPVTGEDGAPDTAVRARRQPFSAGGSLRGAPAATVPHGDCPTTFALPATRHYPSKAPLVRIRVWSTACQQRFPDPRFPAPRSDPCSVALPTRHREANDFDVQFHQKGNKQLQYRQKSTRQEKKDRHTPCPCLGSSSDDPSAPRRAAAQSPHLIGLRKGADDITKGAAPARGRLKRGSLPGLFP